MSGQRELKPTSDRLEFYTEPGNILTFRVFFLRAVHAFDSNNPLDFVPIPLAEMIPHGPLMVEGIPPRDISIPITLPEKCLYSKERYVLVFCIAISLNPEEFPRACILRLGDSQRVLPIRYYKSSSSASASSSSSPAPLPPQLVPGREIKLIEPPLVLPPPPPPPPPPPATVDAVIPSEEKTKGGKKTQPKAAAPKKRKTPSLPVPVVPVVEGPTGSKSYRCSLCGAQPKKDHPCPICKECLQELVTPGHRRCEHCKKCLVGIAQHVCKKKKKQKPSKRKLSSY